MEFIPVIAIAFLASGLTLFSGFGLGTVLMPAFALVMPVEVAIAATAVVHLANNLFKLWLVGAAADRGVLLRFAVPAVFASLIGAALLVRLSGMEPLLTYSAFGSTRTVAPLSFTIGVLIVVFALLELIPAFARLSMPRSLLPIGGLLSGFFGGLSGNQGALRAAFLIKANLSKEAYIATGVVAAVLVDVVRLGTYGLTHFTRNFALVPSSTWPLVGAATLAAFLGAYAGARFIGKITLRTVQLVVAAVMVAVGLALAAGLI
jgi:uncharacterized membrane protein YfcA